MTDISFAELSKAELHALADGLGTPDAAMLNCCVDFVVADTEGLWHGRARALMCRRLKHCRLDPELQAKLVGCILQRLRSGHFSEQFKDQLRLALTLDAEQTLAVSRTAMSSAQDHIRRYAEWALSRRNDHGAE